MITIEPLTKEYLNEVTALDASIFPYSPWGRHSFEGNLENAFDHPLIALEDGRLVGYGLLRQIDAGEVLLIAVAPDCRRKGIGRQLLKGLLDEANLGENIFLEVRASNDAAQALYRSEGFSEIARRRNYYHDPEEDAVIMML